MELRLSCFNPSKWHARSLVWDTSISMSCHAFSQTVFKKFISANCFERSLLIPCVFFWRHLNGRGPRDPQISDSSIKSQNRKLLSILAANHSVLFYIINYFSTSSTAIIIPKSNSFQKNVSILRLCKRRVPEFYVKNKALFEI